MCCSRYNKITKCTNCNSDIDNNAICNTCGMECLYSDIIRIEEKYMKNYSCSFSRVPNRHNPYKYCKNWLLLLQGKESVNISSENFDKVVGLAKQWLDQNANVELSCPVIRNWLKRLSLSKYNPNVTWLRKQIESACNIQGHSYELTDDEMNQTLNYFSEISKQFISIKQDPEILCVLERKNLRNILYYPFIIVKILSHIIQDKTRL